MERVVGIAPERDLPTFTRDTLESWMADRDPAINADAADHRVLLFPDTYSNYVYPEAGRAAVEVLEAAGCHVRLAEEVTASGRAAFSTGFLDLARERAARNVEALAPEVEEGWSVVAIEPSDAVMVQDEYADLLDGESVDRVRETTYGVMEFLDRHRLDENLDVADDDSASTDREHLTYHGHCNQTALNRDHHAVGVLRRVGYEVDPLDSGCCGMAGSFGYEAEHYDLSRAIGRILFEQVEASPGETVVAPGASCRSQLGDREGAARPPHPIEKVAERIR